MKKTLKNNVNAYNKIAKGVLKSGLAAAAALAATDAEADIIGRTINATFTMSTPGYFLDVNNDGTNDLRFFSTGSSQFVNRQGAVNAIAVNGNVNGFSNATALNASAMVSNGNNWNVGASVVMRATNGGGHWGNLANGQTRFLGFRITISGNQNRYGWIRITKNSNTSYKIVDLAYDDSGNPISAGVVPVELTAFRAQIVANAAQLFWSTASEENNAGFEVQRSEDGKNFETLDFVEGHGTTYEAQEYLFDDKSIRENVTYYYRLKQIDFDGKFEYTDIVTAKLEGNANAGAFYPNPALGGITKLNYNATEGGKVNVTVYNINGQSVAELVRTVENGSTVLEFDFSALSKGNYFVKLENGANRQYQKLVIE